MNQYKTLGTLVGNLFLFVLLLTSITANGQKAKISFTHLTVDMGWKDGKLSQAEKGKTYKITVQ